MYDLSLSQKKDYARLMKRIDIFCKERRILQGKGSDSYYFSINGTAYVVSNRRREVAEGTVFILASKTRIMRICEDLDQGLQLNYRGYRENNNKAKEQASC